MKKLILLLFFMTSCKLLLPSKQERLNDLKSVCPNCLLYNNMGEYYALDTTCEPNKLYFISFSQGEYLKTSNAFHIRPNLIEIKQVK